MKADPKPDPEIVEPSIIRISPATLEHSRNDARPYAGESNYVRKENHLFPEAYASSLQFPDSQPQTNATWIVAAGSHLGAGNPSCLIGILGTVNAIGYP